MKKILSLFLSSLILLSLFSGFTVSAATSVALDDGGTLWHKFDYEESSIADKINNASTTGKNLTPTIESANGKNYGKFTVASGAETYLFYTSSTVENNTDRYVVLEYDFKKDDTSGSASGNTYVYFRKSSNRTFYSHGTAAVTDWTHFVLVLDRELDADGKYTRYAYTESDGVYTLVKEKTAATADPFNHVRLYMSGANNSGKSFYVDDLEVKTYGNFYTAINSADSAEKAVTIVERYAGLDLYGVPSSFNTLTPAVKTSVASSLLNKNFASNADAVAALNAAMADLVLPITYLNWDFENGNLNDSVNNEPFMADHPSEPDTARVIAATDPKDETNGVAKMPYSGSTWSPGEILTYTSAVDNGLAAGEFDYLTIDFKIHGDSTTNTFPANLQIRDSSANNKFYASYGIFSKNKWHQLKCVINIPDNTYATYQLENGTWNRLRGGTLPTGFGFYRFEFLSSGTSGDIYYDDFKVTGYNDVISEVVECSAAGIANVLEIYDELQIVDLPASYATLDDAGKLALGEYIKSNVTASTTVAELNEYIKIGASTDELIVLSSANDDAGKLDSLNLFIKKAGVNLASAQLIIATYANDGLEDVKVCDIETALADGSEFEVTELGLDLASAESAKLILVNSLQNLVPAVKATALK